MRVVEDDFVQGREKERDVARAGGNAGGRDNDDKGVLRRFEGLECG